MNRDFPDQLEHFKALCLQSIEALFEKDRLSHEGKLVRGLIHNLGTPLQNVSMLIEMLDREDAQLTRLIHGSGQPELVREWERAHVTRRQRVQRLSQQIDVIASILRDFMDLLSMEESDSEVDLRAALEKLGKVFHADLFFKHQVRLELRLSDESFVVPIPGRYIIPALMHLFHNALTALKASPQKQLIIECQRVGGSVRVLFRDSGCGLAEGSSEDGIFDLFCTHWPEETGGLPDCERHFGIGLYAVRRLLDPYGVKANLKRQGNETWAMLEIPAAPQIHGRRVSVGAGSAR